MYGDDDDDDDYCLNSIITVRSIHVIIREGVLKELGCCLNLTFSSPFWELAAGRG